MPLGILCPETTRPLNKTAGALRWLPAAALLCLLPSPVEAQRVRDDSDNVEKKAQTPQPLATPQRASATSPDEGDKPEEGEDIVHLSPFEVTTSTRGYFGGNTTAGTRMNASIDDIAASVTVITKEFMNDFGILDINDAFAYEAGTEGMDQWTNVGISGDDALLDNTMRDPLNSNRVRGLGSVNVTLGNYETSRLFPIDLTLMDGLEISRGPNSSLFGIGSPAGTANHVLAGPALTRNKTTVTARFDNYGGYRQSLDTNLVLIKDKLALRVSGAHQRTAYSLKPSGMDRTVINGMVKFSPWKWTTITGIVSKYRENGTRVNTMPPSDGITSWISQGQPAYNPHTNTVTFADGSSLHYSSASATVSARWANQTYRDLQLFIDQGQTYLTFKNSSPVDNPLATLGDQTLLETRMVVDPAYQGQILFKGASQISDRSIYDWTRTNMGAADTFDIGGQISLVQFEHIFVHNRTHQLAFQFGWFREQGKNDSLAISGINRNNGSSTRVLIDLNTHLLDDPETLNPYFGRPYLSIQPYFDREQVNRDTFRAQLGYQLNLTHKDGWMRWLGKHNLSAYAEYKDFVYRRLRWAHTIVSNHSWYPPDKARGVTTYNSYGGLAPIDQRLMAPAIRVYLGDSIGHDIDRAPSYYSLGSQTLQWGSATEWTSEEVVMGAAINQLTGGSRNNHIILKTAGTILQSHFLDDRIITTMGWRHDEQYSTTGAPVALAPDGVNMDYDQFKKWIPEWNRDAGETITMGMVFKPFRPLAIYANKSNSFSPVSARRDIFFNRVDNPHGIGNDYGVMLSLLRGKLWLRFNRFNTSEKLSSSSPLTKWVNQILAIDFEDPNLRAEPNPERRPYSLQTQATKWARTTNPAWTQEQINAYVAGVMQVPVEKLQAPRWENYGTADIAAKGFEIEAVCNPTPYWTLKLNITKTQTIDTRIGREVMQWIDERQQVWESILIPDGCEGAGNFWWETRYRADNGDNLSPQLVLQNEIMRELKLVFDKEGYSRDQIRKYRVNLSTKFSLSGITSHPVLKGISLTAAVRWEAKGGIGYWGKGIYSPEDLAQTSLPVLEYDRTRPIYDKARTYCDFGINYSARLSKGVRATFQINVKNAFESGRLQPVAAWPDGTIYGYRIVSPRYIYFATNFTM